MGLFNRNKESKNAIQVNEVAKTVQYPWYFSWKKDHKCVSSVYLAAIMNQIYNGISNVSWLTSKKNDSTTANICEFIDANAPILVDFYISKGYICIFYNEKNEYRIPKDNEIKKDEYGRIINRHAVVIYSPYYQTKRKSLLEIARPTLIDIDNLATADASITDTLGLLGIMSSSDIPLNPAGREVLRKEMQEEYGTFSNNFHYLLAPHDVKFTPMQPNVSDLNLRGNMKEAFKVLCNLFSVPLPLIFDESSTYNNVKEARVYFYSTTIRSYAEVLLKIAQELLTASNEFIPKNTLNYKFENIPELETSLSAACNERMVYLDYLLKMKEAGLDVDKELSDLQQESQDLLKRT